MICGGIRHSWRWSMPVFRYFAAGSRGMMVQHRFAAPTHPRRWPTCCNRHRRSTWSFLTTICIDWVRLPGRSGVIRTSTDYDLAIVGGGLAGCAAAIHALRAVPASRVLVLERGRYPRQKVCGEFLSAEGVAMLCEFAKS